MSYYLFNRQEILQKAKKHILKKKLLNITYKTKKLEKKRQEIIIETCQKKKKIKLNSIKERGIKN